MAGATPRSATLCVLVLLEEYLIKGNIQQIHLNMLVKAVDGKATKPAISIILRRLVAREGWLERLPSQPHHCGGTPRHPYRLTPLGRRELPEYLRRYRSLIR